MIIPHIVYKSLRQHLVSTLVSAVAIALAGGLLMAVWVMRQEANRTFTSVSGGFDAVLGARSSKLQLVLNAIFHLEDSPGNITAADVEMVRRDPNVELALPIAVGDNYKGYRLVGTTTDLFERVEFAPGRHYRIVAPGRPFTLEQKEAVVGSFVARELGLKPGDTFHPFHGLIYDESMQHAETFVVTGVFEPTGTPADRVIWIPLEGLQRMSGHDARAATDVSAVLIKLRQANPMSGFQMDMLYNKRGNKFTFAWPIGAILARLFDKIAWFDRTLAFISYLVVVVATASILASIYNSMNERRREIAILRALGARRVTVFGAIVAESAAIAAIGMLFAFVFYGVVVVVASGIIRAQTGVVINPFELHPVMLAAPAGIIALAALCGVFPAIRAYRTDVASSISPTS
ncbi:ABC-type transport system, involved in lipoprotein release, permease component [Opitutaceae bacterium TAV1]|nr:ABC-type transport system, involved in lipoprotein release, permease component [Opitutaceae bacterium TAV1]